MSTRRGFFKRLALLPGGADLLAALLSSVQKAAAIDPPAGSAYLDAAHVVILMQENRSFDHVFGTLRGVRGFNDPRAVTLPDGNPVWMQTNGGGETYAPFWLNFKDTKATWLGSLPHSWRDQTDARNHGNHDNWLEAKASKHEGCAGMPFTLGYYGRADLPFYYALADAFTICDQHFCSSLTATTPNRLHLWTGTIRARQDPSSPANVRNSDVDYNSPARWPTFPERLEEAGISWKIYQNEISLKSGLAKEEDAWLANFTDNPLEWFEQYRVELSESRRRYLERVGAPSGGPEKPLTPRERALNEKAFTTNAGDPDYRSLATLRYRDGSVEREMKIPKGDVLYQFRRDVRTGKLPTVSWLVASENFSDHPSAPWYGAWYVAEVIDILTRDPDVWKNTIFILTYDENDGYFDHVPPFVAPDPSSPETGKTSPGIGAELEYWPLKRDLARHPEKEARGGPIGLGYRVPLIVASPWSRGGYVCSQVFDHTSVLQLLETVLSHNSGKPIKETNISGWRRTVCGDLRSAFHPPKEQGSQALPFPSKDEFLESVHNAQFKRFPSGYQKLSAEDRGAFERDRFAVSWMPQQENGVRPSCALPYQLYAGANLSSDRRSVELSLEARTEIFGKESAGAPFHVYTPGKFRDQTNLRTRAYAVLAGDRLTDLWELAGFENNRYRLRVHGPNGFFREFTGDADDPPVEIQCEYVRDPAGGIEVQAINHGAPCVVHIADRSYGGEPRSLDAAANAKSSLVFPLRRSFGWYDLHVSVAGCEHFERRFAGRMETGQAGFSDPAMGRVKI